MKKIIALLFALPVILSAADIYMAGDSTMAHYAGKYPPLTGWGMEMQKLCKEGVAVHNRAVGGRSSKSFITEKLWEKIMNDAKKGDFVIIQFGHNDAARGDKNLYRSTYPENTYRHYLRIYIDEARSKGLIPILCTQTLLCDFGRDGKLAKNRPMNEKYVAACREIAKETGCFFIDINACAAERLAKLTQAEAESYYMVVKKGEYPNYPDGKNDRCHLHKRGAEFYAKMFVEEAKKQQLPIAELFK